MLKKSPKEFYKTASEQEWNRLVKDAYHKLEFETTLRFLKKYLPDNGLILDAGGGPGRYTIELAKLGYDVVLLDITPELLEKAKLEIKKAGVEDKIKGVIEGSITDLSQFDDEKFDGVCCLGGPLSHVEKKEDREKAVSELFRVAKKDAPIFISVMGRLGTIIDCLLYWPQEIKDKDHFKRFWQDGDDYSFCRESYAHFFMPEELDELINSQGKVEVVERVGLEGLAHNSKLSPDIGEDNELWQNWLEMHQELCTRPEVYATSGHMMIISKKV
jgi:ubiquinone/menaquinone biosynthesis C-methylase UbiE